MERVLHQEDAAPGLPANYIQGPAERKALTAYFAWALGPHRRIAWEGLLLHQQLPYEPNVGKRPSTEAYVLERTESDHSPVRDWFDPLRRR